MAFPHLFILPLIAFGGTTHVVPKHVGAPSADLLNGRLRSPDAASVGRPSGHAMIPIEFDAVGNWRQRIPVPARECRTDADPV